MYLKPGVHEVEQSSGQQAPSHGELPVTQAGSHRLAKLTQGNLH
jgi:hypothetical protein